MAILEMKHVWKAYDTKVALEDVSFSLEAGEICGLLGMNGAGKSTLMKIVASLSRPTTGTIAVGGIDVTRDYVATNAMIGAMIEAPSFHPELTGDQNLMASAILRPGVTKAQIFAAVETVGLNDMAGIAVKKYSLGMKQRLHFAHAVMAKPKLLLLDEPLSGIDPVAAKRMRNAIHALAAEGAAILVSSHVLREIEHLCPRVCILDRGRIVFDGPIAADTDLEALFLSLVEEGGQAQ